MRTVIIFPKTSMILFSVTRLEIGSGHLDGSEIQQSLGVVRHLTTITYITYLLGREMPSILVL